METEFDHSFNWAHGMSYLGINNFFACFISIEYIYFSNFVNFQDVSPLSEVSQKLQKQQQCLTN